MSPPIISLISDFGLADEYVGVIKGVILSGQPEATIVDICHTIPPQDVAAGAFILSRSYRYFPTGTIFIAIVDPGVGSNRHILAAEWAGKVFIGPDNGILSAVLRAADPSLSLYRITTSLLPEPSSATFHGRDIMAPLAAMLAGGLAIDQVGTKTKVTDCCLLPLPPLEISASGLTGAIIHIDGFGNLCTSITKADAAGLGPAEELMVRIGSAVITGIRRCYADGEGLTALWDSHDHLEIAQPGGSAQKELQAKRGDSVTVSLA